MRDVKSEAEEKADKEKRDWRTLDENVKMSRLYVAPVEKGADGKRTARLLTPGALSVNEFTWSPDGKTIAFEHQKTPSVNDWPTSDVSMVSVSDGAVKPLAASRAAETEPQSTRPMADSIAFVVSDDPPSWAGDRRVHVVPAAGGASRALALTPDQQPDIVGWSADGARLVVNETIGVAGRLLSLPADGGAPSTLESGPLSIGAATINRAGTTLGYVAQDVDRAPEPFAAPLAPTIAGVKVASVQPAFERAARTQRDRHVEVDRRSRHRRPPDLSGGLQGRRACATVTGDPRRPCRRLRTQLHRRCESVSDRGVRGARLCRAAGQPARQQRLRQGLQAREPQRLGRRRLSRPDERRRSRRSASASPIRRDSA